MPASTGVCDALIGPARSACESAAGMTHGAAQAASFVSDPLGSIAHDFADAASWFIKQLVEAISNTTRVDFTNPGFLREYAVVFAASSILTLILWVIAVMKRAVRGVPLGTAIGEAVGFLWLAVAASAFTPLALALTIGLTDELTNALMQGTGADTNKFLNDLSGSIKDPLTGGAVVLILVSVLAIAAAVLIWVELLIRAAILYVGGILGCAVYAGLVDRDLWHHVRRWAGVMVAVDLSKPVLVIVLSLAAAVTSTPGTADPASTVLSGLAIMFLSIFTSFFIYKFVPTFGDDMANLHAGRKSAANAGPAASVPGPTSYIRDGIATHGTRSAARASSSSGAAAGAGAAAGVAAGIAAHGGKKAVGVARDKAGALT